MKVKLRYWGTYGKKPDINNLELQWVKIEKLSNNHIKAILITELQITADWRAMFETELLNRLSTGTIVPDVERYANCPLHKTTLRIC